MQEPRLRPDRDGVARPLRPGKAAAGEPGNHGADNEHGAGSHLSLNQPGVGVTASSQRRPRPDSRESRAGAGHPGDQTRQTDGKLNKPLAP